MKKLISLGLTLVFALSLVACDMGNNANGGAGGNSNGSTSNSDGTGGNGTGSGGTGGNGNGGMSSAQSGIDSAIDGAQSAIQSAGDAVSGAITMTAKITADEARDAALKHAGLAEADVTGIDVDLDRDGGVLKYEVDFRSGNIEYDYDINAETGEVISADKDRD